MLYGVISELAGALREAQGMISGVIIDPAVFTKEGRIIIYNHIKAKRGLVAAQMFAWDWSAYQGRMEGDMFKAFSPVALTQVRKWERILEDVGFIAPDPEGEEKIHMVDKVAGTVLSPDGTRWFWGGAIALALLPGALETVRVVKGLNLRHE